MKYLLLVCVLLTSCLFGGIARAGDLLFYVTSGKQDLLAVAEVTAQEPAATHIRVLFNFPQSKIKNTQTTHIFNADTNPLLRVGGIYLVSLNKEKDGFINAYGIHPLSSSDYRSAVLLEPMSPDGAALQWFLHSGGRDTSFFSEGKKMYVERGGIERLIYPSVSENTVPDSFLQTFSLRDISPIYLIMMGVVFWGVLFAGVFFTRKFPEKKWMLPLFLIDGLIAVAIIGYVGWDPSRRLMTQSNPSDSITEAQAIELIRTHYPELNDYPNPGLPTRRIRLQPAPDGWDVAFMQLGSGRPLLSAKCVHVRSDRALEERGMFQSTSEMTSFSELDLHSCRISP